MRSRVYNASIQDKYDSVYAHKFYETQNTVTYIYIWVSDFDGQNILQLYFGSNKIYVHRRK